MSAISRSLLAVLAALMVLTAIPQSASAAKQFGLQRLRQDTQTGAENYVFTGGGTVFAQATVDPAYYRFSVVDAGGTVRSSTACTQSLSKKSATYKYAVQAADPTTTGTAWRFRLDEWGNFACSGTPTKTSSKYFTIARASSFSDAALTTARRVFAAGSSPYLKVAGLGAVRLTAPVGAQSDWQTTWLRPGGATACANTRNADRPDSDASGVLAAGSYMKYRPNAGAPSAAWNLESNYETRPCQDLDATNEGVWSIRLQKDATHFVTLPAFTVDATPPDTTIISRPAGGTPFTSPDLEFVANQPDATFECQLDGGGWGMCSSPKHYATLAESSHTFQVRAIDPAGNVDATPASATWTVDTTLPGVTFTAPASGTATSDTTPDFSGAAGTAVGDSATVTVKIMQSVQGGPDQLVQTLTTTRSGATWSVAPSTALAEGTYKVHAEQSDAAGTGFSDEHSFRVDTTAPDVSILEPRTASLTSDTTPQLWGTGGLATGDAGTVTVKLWNGSTASGAPAQTASVPVDSSGNWSVDASPALADGNYTVRAEQDDDAANLGVSRAHTFTVDSTAPDTNITAGPSGSTSSTSAGFRFATNEPGSTFECLIDDGDWGPCGSPKTYSNLAAGSHTFQVHAIDAAGNEDPSPSSAGWTVDTSLPAVTLVNPSDGTATNAIAPVFDGSAGMAPGDSATITVNVYRPVAGAPDELVESRTTNRAADGSWSTTANPALPEGAYIVRAEQADAASNVGTSAAHSFNVDTTAPDTLFNQTPPAITGTTSAGFRFDSTEAGASFECRLDGAAWAACSSPDVESGLGAGTHTFRVRAIDAAGNTDVTPATVTWLVNPALPALTLASPVDGSRTSDATPSFGGVAGVGVGDLGTVTLKVYRPVAGAPDDLIQTRTTTRSSLDGSWSVTASPELEDGHYWAYAEQDGSVGTAVSAATSFTVDTAPPHTTISSGPQGSTVATAASFSFGAGEADSTFECRLDGGAWGACTSPRSYTGLGDGVHTFEVRATDDVGNTDPTPASRTWSIDTSGAAVTLESPADNALTNDSTPLFTGHASTGAGDSDTVNVEVYRPVAGGADELVQTLSVVRSAVNGSWSVVASPALADGTYLAYATQDDSNAETAYSAPRTFTVDASEPGVTLTTPAGGSTTNDTTPMLAGGAGSDGGDSATVTVKLYTGAGVSGSPIQTLPATRSGGSWSIEPSVLADGTYTAQATQPDAAGNTGTAVPRSFTVDATGPDTAIDSGPSGNTTTPAADFGFSSPEPEATFECKLDGAAWTACSAPRSYSGLAVGSHTFAVRALDALGNPDGTPASRTWTIDPPAGGGGGTGGGETGGGETGGGIVTPSGSLTFSLSGKKTLRVGGRRPRLTLSATCSADCALKLSGKIMLSRARAAGLSKRAAAGKRLKLRAKTYRLTAGTKTRIVMAIPRRLAKLVLAGLKQRREVSMRVTGGATSSNAVAPPRPLRIRLKR